MSRYVVKTLLILAGLVAVAVALVVLGVQGGNNPTAWATLSAALAVVAAVISGWTSQRVVELQEDALAPNPVPWIDMRSRYQVAQFKISNRGASSAYNVQLGWEQPLENAQREPVLLGVNSAIPIIGPGEDASINLGLDFEYLKVWTDTTRRGTITFDDATGKRRTHPFIVSAEHERKALDYTHERVRTEYEVQQIPDELKKIVRELHRANELRALNRPSE